MICLSLIVSRKQVDFFVQFLYGNWKLSKAGFCPPTLHSFTVDGRTDEKKEQLHLLFTVIQSEKNNSLSRFREMIAEYSDCLQLQAKLPIYRLLPCRQETTRFARLCLEHLKEITLVSSWTRNQGT